MTYNRHAPFILEAIKEKDKFRCDKCDKVKDAQAYTVTHKTEVACTFDICRSCYAEELLDEGVEPRPRNEVLQKEKTCPTQKFQFLSLRENSSE